MSTLLDLTLTQGPAKAYLDHLTGLQLEFLLAEPTSISSHGRNVESELINLCFREYSTFISVHQCSAAVNVAFGDFEESLGRLLNSVPELEDACHEFSRGTTSIQNGRGQASLVQEQQDKLIDLLEIPQLMETCIRNGYYQEALELASHLTDMSQRHPNPLIIDVCREVEGILVLMFTQLLGLLREPVKLPTLIKAINYLRRLDRLDEQQLSLVFLVSRLQNFRSDLVNIERDRAEPVRYVRKYVDAFREHVYDIISQYLAIFPAETAGTHISSFARLCVDDLTELVSNYAPRLAHDSASLASILIQLGYCAQSFARVGLDFSCYVGQSFVETVIAAYKASMNEASQTLTHSLSQANRQPDAYIATLAVADHDSHQLSELETLEPSTLDETPVPPASLANYPPVGRFVNAHITALNALRLLAPFGARHQLQEVQRDVLGKCTSSVLQSVLDIASDKSHLDPRRRHSRSHSSPRADLLRRNTETQWTPELREAKRRQTLAACLGLAEAWLAGVDFLSGALRSGIFGQIRIETTSDFDPAIELREWVRLNRIRSSLPATNGFHANDNSTGEAPASATSGRADESVHGASGDELVLDEIAASPPPLGDDNAENEK